MAKPSKTPAFLQVAALPWRRDADGTVRVVLVTSRERGRWILPKGWPIKGLKDCEAAETEAMEEAGLVGRVTTDPIGRFQYDKSFPKRVAAVAVDVYGLEVERQLDDWLEKGQREVRWLKPDKAAKLAADTGVGALILAFVATLTETSRPAPQPAESLS
ncbi:NUDIX hydrolase [Oharaeibacter diazotrophicus]|uniref:NUDIX hydrolase n=1 Tax=Oharaeibacter diazotrophicus TaxID=1920512 RepID=UPI001FE229CF|nr:NUDIX hydrolase [Oharaeibacter diazotrophicus]